MTDRGSRRLRLAAAWLGWEADSPKQVLTRLLGLPPSEAEDVRGVVDWLEKEEAESGCDLLWLAGVLGGPDCELAEAKARIKWVTSYAQEERKFWECPGSLSLKWVTHG